MIKKILVLILIVILFNTKIDFFKSDEEIKKDSQEAINIVDKPKNDYYNIELGDSTDEVIQSVGRPARIDKCEYGFEWYVYNQNLKEFFMIGISNDEVVGMYSNSMNSIELEDIKINQDKKYIKQNYQPIEYKKKNNIRYIINSNDEYDILHINKKYITIFYDIHDESKIVSYQIINENQEDNLEGVYSSQDEEIQKSYELQIIDLCNCERIKEGLNPLEYKYLPQISSQKHSEDMMENNYFDHVNLKQKTPFDRMKEEGIEYTSAGENIAAGQTNAIYAHEAWMNSMGHRKNILGNYKYIGVGIAFGGHYKIYYTQNFYK